jgi:hypothetical protein
MKKNDKITIIATIIIFLSLLFIVSGLDNDNNYLINIGLATIAMTVIYIIKAPVKIDEK